MLYNIPIITYFYIIICVLIKCAVSSNINKYADKLLYMVIVSW